MKKRLSLVGALALALSACASVPTTDTSAGPIVRNLPVRLRTRSAAWRREMLQKIFVPLRAFAPDLIVVSAGFDAHAHDALEAGGLHVIGTNLHDSRRVDDQLRGRAGRQGDPGSSHFFLSLEDRRGL